MNVSTVTGGLLGYGLVTGGFINAASVAIVQLFEQALFSQLSSITGLTSLIGTTGSAPAIFTQGLPQTYQLSSQGPAISYTIPTKPFGNVLSGSDGTAIAQIQIDIWALANYLVTKQIAEAIRLAMKPGAIWGNGTCIIMSVVKKDDSDASERPQAGSDKWLNRVISEYTVKYRVALPTG